jgi:hypothetical protein
MNGKIAQDDVRGLLDGVTVTQLKAMTIESLRIWWATRPSDRQFQTHDQIGGRLVPLLAARVQRTLTNDEIRWYKEPFVNALHLPWMSPFVEVVGWMIGAGLAIPLGAPNNYPTTLHLLDAGVRLLESATDHPLLPGFLDRIRTRCPGIPDGVLSLLTDATACLDRNLRRAAVMVMGVAYEVAIEQVNDHLVATRSMADADGAARRITNIRGQIDLVMPATTSQERDERFAVHQAYLFADALRRRRNDGAHTTPSFGFDDSQETEELLASAGRHLPNLWKMRLV